MRLVFTTLAFLGLGPLFSFGQQSKAPDPQTRAGTRETTHAPLQSFDPARNAAADIDQAIAEARKTGKRILIDIGGDWCPWCRQLEGLFQQHPDLLRTRDQNFITVPVYYGSENKNERVLSRYSKVLGIPHCFVLDSSGTLLHSQHMVDLQMNGNYNPDKMKEFLTKWAPPSANTSRAGLGSKVE